MNLRGVLFPQLVNLRMTLALAGGLLRVKQSGHLIWRFRGRRDCRRRSPGGRPARRSGTWFPRCRSRGCGNALRLTRVEQVRGDVVWLQYLLNQ